MIENHWLLPEDNRQRSDRDDRCKLKKKKNVSLFQFFSGGGVIAGNARLDYFPRQNVLDLGVLVFYHRHVSFTFSAPLIQSVAGLHRVDTPS